MKVQPAHHLRMIDDLRRIQTLTDTITDHRTSELGLEEEILL
jgi:hypothetical protein